MSPSLLALAAGTLTLGVALLLVEGVLRRDPPARRGVRLVVWALYAGWCVLLGATLPAAWLLRQPW